MLECNVDMQSVFGMHEYNSILRYVFKVCCMSEYYFGRLDNDKSELPHPNLRTNNIYQY